ncbi:MAG: hypothetical protein K8R73_06360 [Clostridiales bacterium]|nr:hypothetical protein [Clostridiales bacterium]
MKIALISCTSSKKSYSCKASEMYTPSPRFSLAYQYAKQVADVVYVLSAKYGLLEEDNVIEPYNVTMNNKSTEEKRVWSEHVIKSLAEKHSLDSDEFIIIAGRAYNEFIIPALKHHTLPLEGQSMGRWIPKLKELIGSNSTLQTDHATSLMIHDWMTNLPRYDWKEIDKIPFENGIYIMFESGEKFYDMDRIVRIGTHQADERLKKRLKDHFKSENKDGSILRKNIGLSILHQNNHSFENIWSLNWSKPEIKNQYLYGQYISVKKEIEMLVSEYLRSNITFACIPVKSKKDRLDIEGALIATLNHDEDFISSINWLGRHSPKPEIALSGLWNTQGLKDNRLNLRELQELKSFIMNEASFFKKDVHTIDIVEKKMPKKKLVIESGRVSTSDIKIFILSVFESSKREGQEYVEIVSGEIHKQMNLSNKMPSVCSAMYQLMNEKDVVIHTTPSGKSSTIRIRYYLE